MATTHIDTNAVARTELPGQGQVADILNKALCGAENVVGKLRWLKKGDSFSAEPLADTHQLPMSSFEVTEIVLMKSELLPAGSRYTVIARASLQ